MLATEAWGEAEIAIVENDLAHASACAARMIDVALAHRHETLTGIAHQLASWIAQLRGDAGDALSALKNLIRREQAARAESLKSRVNVIEWQLALRHNRHEVEKLASANRLFEKLAMEDALTGLPNRRALEARLETDFGRPMQAERCLALVDVDRFKDINDRHSHQVGDEVLQAVAAAFRRNVREADFCARLAGDEFVLLFHCDLPAAQQICARIQAELASGLAHRPAVRMSVSIGLVRVNAVEPATQALARADAAMYSAKAGGRSA
jgi:diguanylate cyclase (GGDEF)-like protein